MTVAVSPFTTIENALQKWVADTSGIAATSVIWSQQADQRPGNPWISLLLHDIQKDGIGWVDVEPNPLVFADTPVTANATTNQLAATAHGRSTGDGPVRFTTTVALPAPLQVLTDYWLVKIDADHLKVAATFEDAIATSPTTIDLTDAGTGAHKLVSTADTVAAGKEILHVVRAYYKGTLTMQCYADPPTGENGGTEGADQPLSPTAILQAVSMSSMLPSIRSALEAAGVGFNDIGPVRSVGEAIEMAVFEPRAVVDVMLWLVAQVSETGGTIDQVTVEVVSDRSDGTFLIDGSGVTTVSTAPEVTMATEILTNADSVDVPPGTPVYISSGSHFMRGKADASSTAKLIGLVVEPAGIVAGLFGLVGIDDGVLQLSTTQWDLVTGQTGGLTPGASYWLSAATAGKLTITAPAAPGQFDTFVGTAISTTKLDVAIEQPIGPVA